MGLCRVRPSPAAASGLQSLHMHAQVHSHIMMRFPVRVMALQGSFKFNTYLRYLQKSGSKQRALVHVAVNLKAWALIVIGLRIRIQFGPPGFN